MNERYPPLAVRVWGEYACFTRPEMKVERVTYPVITPSAARGVLEAIFWKPEFSWRVSSIAVLRPIRYFSILRNEVNTRASERSARGWEKSGGGYDASADRAQRHTLALRDVEYVIHAQIEVRPGRRRTRPSTGTSSAVVSATAVASPRPISAVGSLPPSSPSPMAQRLRST